MDVIKHYSTENLYPAQQISLDCGDFKNEKLSKRAKDTDHVVNINLDGFNFLSDEGDFVIEYLSTNIFYHLSDLILTNTKGCTRLFTRMWDATVEGLRYPSLTHINIKNTNGKCHCCGRGDNINELLPMIKNHFISNNYIFIRESEQLSQHYNDEPAVFLCIVGCEYEITKTNKIYTVLYKNDTTNNVPLIFVVR